MADKNLNSATLTDYVYEYLFGCVSHITPFAMECIVLAFSPSIGKFLATKLPDFNIDDFQSKLQDQLKTFTGLHQGGYAALRHVRDKGELDISSQMYNEKDDVKRLLRCFQQRVSTTDRFADKLLNHIEPMLEKHGVTFENLFPNEYKKAQEKLEKNKQQKQQNKNPIGFGTDLTQTAKNLSTPPVLFREQEIKLIENYLLKQNRSNVILVGKNGTGKTALVEGLAYNITHKLSHPLLSDTKIISVDFGTLMRGTTYRGQLEEKVLKMMEKISESNSILFLDELHSLFSSSAKDNSVATMIKPFLTNGKTRVIAATTDEEFLSIHDSAFLRRFNQINVSEPTPEITLNILKGIKPTYEKTYSISIPNEVLVDIVKKSNLYIHNKNFPDKSIDLLNYVCVLATNAQDDKKCNIDMVNKALIDAFNIPLEMLETSESMQILTLQDKLNDQVFGQQNAIEQVSATLTHSYILHTNKSVTPQASFLFCGPSGVGKTKTAEEIAALLGRGFSVFNMNEYQNEIDVQKLTGAAPGYVGYESGGQLTNIVSQNPYTVLLFDEFEKAHKNIQRLLLQILDKGTFTDNRGMKVDFNNTIIIMATNAGVQNNSPIGYGNTVFNQNITPSMLSKTFMPEFLGRINQIVTFKPLEQPVLHQIVDSLCYELCAQIKQEYRMGLSISPAVRDFVIQKGFQPALGARIIKNTFKQEVEMPVALEVIKKCNSPQGKQNKLFVDLINDKVVCKTR